MRRQATLCSPLTDAEAVERSLLKAAAPPLHYEKRSQLS